MTQRTLRPIRSLQPIAVSLSAALALVPGIQANAADHLRHTPVAVGAPTTAARWAWPVDAPIRFVQHYAQPAHKYGAGHRGLDLVASGDVYAPADGTVAFVGMVVDRPLLTIDHGNNVISTLEPVHAAVTKGQHVDAGQSVGTVSVGGHAAPGTVHIGVRVNGEYVNPLRLLTPLPRAVLLPIP